MDQIHQQVRRARRRLVLEQFLNVVGWALLAGLLVAALGIGAAKIWAIPVDSTTWLAAWIGGGLGLGLLAAVLITTSIRRRQIDAALEIDRRFGLKERVSSSLELQPHEIETDMGRALLADVTRRVADLDIRDHFRVRAPWSISLPFVAAVVVFLLTLLTDATVRQAQKAQASTETAKLVKTETEKLRQQLQEKRERLEAQGLKDAEELLNQLEKAIDDLQNKSDVDRKQAMIKVNEMSKMIEERREKLAGADELKKQLDNLKSLQQGPADRIADALKQGDFKAAMGELQKLQEKLAAGNLSPEDQKKLAEQLSEMSKRLEEAKRAFEDAKRDLEEQIKQKQRAGDMQAVNELQKKLNQLNKMNSQMNQLNQLAQSLGQSAQSMQNGDMQSASQQLQESMQSLQQLQSELAQLETLNEMLDQLSECKGGLGEGEGEMLSSMMSPNMGSSMSQIPGMGLGEGQGQGDRPEEATDTQSYESRVAAKLQKGRAVVAGTADGPNIAGQSREAVKEAILGDLKDTTPVIDEQLPRDQLEHAREYFKRYVSDDK